MLEGVFWSSLLLLLYIYIGYPGVLLVLGKIKRYSPKLLLPECWPAVSIVVAAHNEESTIGRRIENLLALDYPPDKLEVLIVSDASTDGTNGIISQFTDPRIRLIARDKREGKTAALNVACPQAKGDILLFTDANGVFSSRDTVKNLIRHFADPRVGAVCGAVKYVDPRDTAAYQGESLYMHYDTWVKQLESRLGSVMGAFGGNFAFRREFFSPMDAMLPVDLEVPLQVLRKGYDITFEESAISVEPASGRMGVEFARHARINARLFYGMGRWMGDLVRPLRPLVLFQFLSKKVLRWFSPFLFFSLIGLPVFSQGPLFRFVVVVNGVFLTACAIGALLSWCGRSHPMFSYALHFFIGNLAVAWGFAAFLTGRQGPTWSVARQPGKRI